MPGVAKRIECDAHGSGEATYACQHFAAGTALLYFFAESEESSRPDAWCEKCECERQHDPDGDWTEESEAFAGIRLLCHLCYDERRTALRLGRGLASDVSFLLRYRCGGCDEDHVGLPTWAAIAPQPYVELNEDKKKRAFLDEDFCEVGEHRFVRTVLELPIVGSHERFVWGVWSSLSEKNYDAFRAGTADPAALLFSWLMTDLPRSIYPRTFALKSMLFLREDGVRPLVVLEPSDHPLSVEQQVGMSPDRARAIAAALLHPT